MARLIPLLLATAVLLLVPATGAPAAKTQATLFEAPRELLSDDAALRDATLDEIEGFAAASTGVSAMTSG